MALFSQSDTPMWLFYKPRKTLYKVMYHVKIKDQSGEWVDGLAYQESGKENSQVYVRPASLFTESKWELYWN